jgi:hypothetical protein
MPQGSCPLPILEGWGDPLPSPWGPMACPICRCRLVARSSVASRGLVCADCGHPVPPVAQPLSAGRLLAFVFTGALLALAGAMALTMALLDDRQLRPEAPASQAATAPSPPFPGPPPPDPGDPRATAAAPDR